MNRLQERYQKIVVPKLQAEFKLKNALEVPRVRSVVISTAFKEAQHQDDAIKLTATWLCAMAGQKPCETRAHNSIAGFNIREGEVIGLKVTLRGARMWDFIDKLFSLALPRVKDFQGLSVKSFDGNGNYTLGLTEQSMFPEVDYDTVGKVRGLQITFVVNNGDDTISRRLFEELGMPFEKGGAK